MGATDAELFHQALHGATRERKALPLQLVPCLAHPIDLIVFIPNPFDLWLQFRISLLSRRCFERISATCEAVIECSLSSFASKRLPGDGRRDRQNPADRLDAVNNALIFNEGDHRFSGRSSSACAK